MSSSMKTILPFILCSILLTSCDIFGSDELFEGGEGTSENPYRISNIDQLQAVDDTLYLDSHFVQVSDIKKSCCFVVSNVSTQ